MIDRSLNYGRHVVADFLGAARPYESVLDIGAGRGVDLLAARKLEPSAALHGVEVDQGAYERLGQLGVHTYRCEIEREPLPLADGSMDVVIMNQVLEHTKEIFWILHEVSRVLSVGGTLILGVPNLASLHNRILLFLGRQPAAIQPHTAHVRGFTRSGLLSLLAICYPGGYRLRAWAGSNFYPFPASLARLVARWLPSLAVGLFLMLEKARPYQGDFLNYLAQNRLQTNFYTGSGQGSLSASDLAMARPDLPVR